MQIVNANVSENYNLVRSILTDFIKKQRSFNNLQYYLPAKCIAETFSASPDVIGNLIEVIADFFEERQALYNQIALTVIPVIVYHGEEENLPEIFDRINSQGTPLDQYEVYAAAWPVSHRFKISNTDIVECAIKKYDAFVEDGFIIHGYDRETMRSSKKVNAFEYLFGLGKFLVNKYDILGFQKTLPDDTVNPLGFELVNACLNDTNKIKTLYRNIYDIKEIDKFESALMNSIDFVVASVSPIMRFKGNSRSGAKLFHSKYQILSMISTTFKEMYIGMNYTDISENWSSKKDTISKNLRLYYVYDIITNYWSEGGTNKIHSAAKPNRYASEISPRAWRNALDAFLDRSMFRAESRQIANPKSEEIVFLNCIYLNTFTAMDQLSVNKFDIEHIAPKEQMKKLIAATKGNGLPISSIANLCYLPEYVNRSKRDRNFYQDEKYLQHINLEEVERKYSFTSREDLEWMDMQYDRSEDFAILKQAYFDFCNSRFSIMKKLFCKSMGIDYDAMNSVTENEIISSVMDDKAEESRHSVTNDYMNECVRRIEQKTGEKLIKISRSTFTSQDGRKGYVFCISKAYAQGNREKYWFGYRRNPLETIKMCKEQYIVYGCRDAREVLLFPVDIIESFTSSMNFSVDDDGEISHWHIVFFREENGHMTQLLSKPEIKEIDVDKYKII